MADLTEPTDAELDGWFAALFAATRSLYRTTRGIVLGRRRDPGGSDDDLIDQAEWEDRLEAAGLVAVTVETVHLVRDQVAGRLDPDLILDLDRYGDDLIDEIATGYRAGRQGVIDTTLREMVDEDAMTVDELARTRTDDAGFDIVNATYTQVADQNQKVSIWYTRRDNRVRDSHQIHSQRRSDTGLFTLNSGLTARRPHDPELPAGERANCRCRLRVVDAGLGSGSTRGPSGRSTLSIMPSSSRSPFRLPVPADTSAQFRTARTSIRDHTAQPIPTGPLGVTAGRDRSAEFRGPVIVIEGAFTDGGDRRIDAGGLYVRELPGLPFWYMTAQTAWGHLGAEQSGALDAVNRADLGVPGLMAIGGAGELNLRVESGKRAQNDYAEGWIRGVSVDLEPFQVELRTENDDVIETYDDYEEAVMAGLEFYTAFVEAAIIGLTGTSQPAMDAAQIEMVSDEGRALVASRGGRYKNADRIYRYHLPLPNGLGAELPGSALVASAGVTHHQPTDLMSFGIPQSGWFSDAGQAAHAFAPTFYPSGQLDGYLARWDRPHPLTGQYATRSQNGYATLYGGGTSVTTTDGEMRAGILIHGFDGCHPDPSPGRTGQWALGQYLADGTPIAYFRAYDDGIGVRIRGGAADSITRGQWSEIKGIGMSGDWRDDPGAPPQELICASTTHNPAFRTGIDEPFDHAQGRYEEAGFALVANADVWAKYSGQPANPAGAQWVAGQSKQTPAAPTHVDVARLTAIERSLDKLLETQGRESFDKAIDRIDRIASKHVSRFSAVPAHLRRR